MNPETRVLGPALIHWVSPFTFLHLFPKGETWSSKKTQKSDFNTTLSCSSPPAITTQAHADPRLSPRSELSLEARTMSFISAVKSLARQALKGHLF